MIQTTEKCSKAIRKRRQVYYGSLNIVMCVIFAFKEIKVWDLTKTKTL